MLAWNDVLPLGIVQDNLMAGVASLCFRVDQGVFGLAGHRDQDTGGSFFPDFFKALVVLLVAVR